MSRRPRQAVRTRGAVHLRQDLAAVRARAGLRDRERVPRARRGPARAASRTPRRGPSARSRRPAARGSRRARRSPLRAARPTAPTRYPETGGRARARAVSRASSMRLLGVLEVERRRPARDATADRDDGAGVRADPAPPAAPAPPRGARRNARAERSRDEARLAARRPPDPAGTATSPLTRVRHQPPVLDRVQRSITTDSPASWAIRPASAFAMPCCSHRQRAPASTASRACVDALPPAAGTRRRCPRVPSRAPRRPASGSSGARRSRPRPG